MAERGGRGRRLEWCGALPMGVGSRAARPSRIRSCRLLRELQAM